MKVPKLVGSDADHYASRRWEWIANAFALSGQSLEETIKFINEQFEGDDAAPSDAAITDAWNHIKDLKDRLHRTK